MYFVLGKRSEWTQVPISYHLFLLREILSDSQEGYKQVVVFFILIVFWIRYFSPLKKPPFPHSSIHPILAFSSRENRQCVFSLPIPHIGLILFPG